MPTTQLEDFSSGSLVGGPFVWTNPSLGNAWGFSGGRLTNALAGGAGDNEVSAQFTIPAGSTGIVSVDLQYQGGFIDPVHHLDVYLDGVLVKSLATAQTTSYTSGSLAEGDHTIKFRLHVAFTPRSGTYTGWIDNLKVVSLVPGEILMSPAAAAAAASAVVRTTPIFSGASSAVAGGALAVKGPPQLVLGAAAAASGFLVLEPLALAPAAAASSATLGVTAATRIPLAPAIAVSAGAAGATVTIPVDLDLQPAAASAADAGLMLGVVPAPDFTEGNVWEGWSGTSTELAYDARDTFDERWGSGQHVGDARPTMLAAVRTGRFMRSYAPWHGDPTATIGRSPQNRPWQATWTPDSAYDFLPNVLSVRQSKAVESAGIGSATIEIENVAYPLIPGGGHLIRRGFLAPLRGYVAGGRDPLVDEGGDEVVPNGWYRKLAKNSQITLWQGYGNIGKVAFTGLIDDVDTTSRPDRIIVTLRDFGQVFSDERVFGWNKDPDIKDPVIFIDRDQADTLTPVYGHATASDSVTGFGPSKSNDSDSNTAWASEAEATPDVTKWLDIELDQQGRYNDYVLWPSFDGMEIYVSVYAKSWIDEDGNEQDPTRDGVPITPDAWVNNGSGLVPGANGGRQYIQHVTGLSATKVTRDLDATYVLGGGSHLRVHFRDLGETTAGSGSYRAGAIDLHARRRTLQEAARKERWILVDDVADIVKIVFRWAGFKEWDVESTGVKLQKRLVIGRDKFYRDVIKICEDAVGYVFFMGDPTNMAASIGVPTFRRPRTVLTDAEFAALGEPIVTVTDELLLTAIKVRETDEPLAYIIRVRGKTSDDGATLGSSSTKRIMYEYRPPWSGTSQDEDGVVTRFGSGDLAGINKPVVYTNNLFRTVDDVKFGALHIALSQALAAITATAEVPAHPGIELDDHVVLKDLGTGVTSRLSITNRDSLWRGGEQASWTMTLAGALIDTPNVQAVLEHIQAARR